MARRPSSVALDDRALAEFTAFAVRLGEIAGRAILPYFRAAIDIDNKAGAGSYDPVTIADRSAETAIREEIARVYPTHGILGEEHGAKPGRDRLTWIIDPIDGTRAFIIGQLHWGVLIALSDGERPTLGMMHQPFTGETFTGSRLGAEWRRGAERRALHTRACPRIEAAAVSATDPAMFKSGAERDAFRALAARARMRRYGGDCYSYCLVAAGLIDLVIEAGLQPYDIQPVIPIIEGAGGIVTSWSGKSAAGGGQCVAAGDPALHRVALEMLSAAATDA
ncbi:MAG TPA: histidinol-phosphatase [Candidatus Binataceae bacterium]|nr:histidinol-phosphatase [Candidatus Binataceae bacterium]